MVKSKEYDKKPLFCPYCSGTRLVKIHPPFPVKRHLRCQNCGTNFFVYEDFGSDLGLDEQYYKAQKGFRT